MDHEGVQVSPASHMNLILPLFFLILTDVANILLAMSRSAETIVSYGDRLFVEKWSAVHSRLKKTQPSVATHPLLQRKQGNLYIVAECPIRRSEIAYGLQILNDLKRSISGADSEFQGATRIPLILINYVSTVIRCF